MLGPRVATVMPMMLKRNIGMTAALQHPAMDPIQELFVNKIREYKQKGGGKLEDVPALVKERNNELERIAKQFGVTPGTDMSKFPDFKFSDPAVDMESLKK